jgi:hypothetical protein
MTCYQVQSGGPGKTGMIAEGRVKPVMPDIPWSETASLILRELRKLRDPAKIQQVTPRRFPKWLFYRRRLPQHGGLILEAIKKFLDASGAGDLYSRAGRLSKCGEPFGGELHSVQQQVELRSRQTPIPDRLDYFILLPELLIRSLVDVRT